MSSTMPPPVCGKCYGPLVDRGSGKPTCDCNASVGLARQLNEAKKKAKPTPVPAAAAPAATKMPRDRSYWATLPAEARTDIIIKAVEILALEKESLANRLERLRTFLVDRGYVQHNQRTHDHSSWIK